MPRAKDDELRFRNAIKASPPLTKEQAERLGRSLGIKSESLGMFLRRHSCAFKRPEERAREQKPIVQETLELSPVEQEILELPEDESDTDLESEQDA